LDIDRDYRDELCGGKTKRKVARPAAGWTGGSASSGHDTIETGATLFRSGIAVAVRLQSQGSDPFVSLGGTH
jgi:hypothetical protein